MKKPEWEQKPDEDFFDAFERHMEERDRWEKGALLGCLTKLWRFIRRGVNEAWWFIRWETTDRYHFLDLRTPDYRRGYIDYDERFIRAAFACLVGMESENWGHKDVTDADLSDNEDENVGLRKQIAQYKEFKELLRWWREERPKLEGDPTQYDIEDEKLMRLVKLRREMWA